MTKMPAPAWIRVGTVSSLASSARHHVTLRSESGSNEYQSLLLFRFPAAPQAAPPDEAQRDDAGIASGSGDDPPRSDQFYCMAASCPHLGAPLDNAEVEVQGTEDDIEDMVVVCPWHEYDFSLRTGESTTGMNTCTYDVRVGSDGMVSIEPPAHSEPAGEGSQSWTVVEVRPVSEAFTRSKGRETAANALATAASKLSLEDPQQSDLPAATAADTDDFVSPTTLTEWAVLVLRTADPTLKVARTRRAAEAFYSGQCKVVGGGYWMESSQAGEERVWKRKEKETLPDMPPRLERIVAVQPGKEGKRGKAGTEKSRIALLHSLANIEQWAIDLAWDLVARAPELGAKLGVKVPLQLYADFIKIAVDEAKHFSLLEQRLIEKGSYFGALPVHHGLWQSADQTKHSLLSRLTIIHLVHEARGLDVNPNTILLFERASDKASVDILTTIHLDEITHVSSGNRWLSYFCRQTQPPLDPVEVFRSEVRTHFMGRLKGPFNEEDRMKAGLTKEWYEGLEGQRRVHLAPVAGG